MSFLHSVGDWVDSRTGYRGRLQAVLDQPIPGGARWAYIWGSVLFACIVVEALTGFAMATVYAPSANTAWPSVVHLTYGIPWGWLVRAVHQMASQVMLVVLSIHLAQVVLFAAYKAPREINWWIGLALLGVTMGFLLTGNRLIWDQMAYWALKVEINITGGMPGGRLLQKLIQGGSDLGSLTLTRLYALHVGVLPVLLILLLALHVGLFRSQGITPPAGADPAKVDSFFPGQAAKNLAAMLVTLVIIFALAWHERTWLDAPADPSSDYPARPEWYLLWLYRLRKMVEGKYEIIATAVIPGILVGYLAALPLLDRSPERSLRPRLRFIAPLAAAGLAIGAMTVLAMRHDATDAAFQKARKIADDKAHAAIELAKKGVPPDGPLAMLRRDPDTRGPELFQEQCATCHRLGDFGPKDGKVTAPDLNGWGSDAWAMSVLDDPDAAHLFGPSCYKGEMLSLVHPPADPDAAKNFKPMPESERRKISAFLAGEAAENKDSQHDAEGAKLIELKCTSCHLFRGQTDDDDGKGPELAGWGSTAWLKQQITNPGSNATYRQASMAADMQSHMPHFDDKLEPGEIALLTDWVRRKARSLPLRTGPAATVGAATTDARPVQPAKVVP